MQQIKQAIQNNAKVIQQQRNMAQATISDTRQEATIQRRLQEDMHNSPQREQTTQLQSIINPQSHEAPIPKKPNNTGLPDNLKSGIENLSGYSMDDVKVHYNSNKPAQLNAHAYAQGTDIHIASGQEQHLPHEAWHVVQQKQGRVKPTMQMKGKVNINDDSGLEREADVMGAKALQMKKNFKKNSKKKKDKTYIELYKSYITSVQGVTTPVGGGGWSRNVFT